MFTFKITKIADIYTEKVIDCLNVQDIIFYNKFTCVGLV